MDISPQGGTGYKLKGKNSVVIAEDGKVKIERDKPFVIDAPGEYEVSGISVIGVQDGLGDIYVVELDNLRTCIVNTSSEKLSEKQVEEVGAIDILVIRNLNPEIVKQIDPWVILTETSSADSTPVAKFSMTSDKLPSETQTVVLERK